MKQKLFDLKCAECGRVFRNPDENERFCPECNKVKSKKKRKPNANKNILQITRELKKIQQRTRNNVILWQVCRII